MIIDGKVYRNLEGQVAYLTEYLNANAVASELGIKVIGTEEDVSDIPAGEYQYGDAYMIGTEVPYTLYIWTRANGNHPEDFWFNVGQFPMPGPTGATGIGVDDVVSAMLNNWAQITATEDAQTDITTITATGTNTETLSDNSTVEIPTTVEIPFYTDGQVTVGAYEDVDSNRAISIGLSKNLDSTYVAQRPGISADYNGVSYVYGGYKSGTTKLNNVQPLPLKFDKLNVVMNVQTGDDADKNSYSTIYSKWNTLLGKGNQLQGNGSTANANTENLVFGGKNILANGVQDSATFGYRNQVYANQAMTHGYKNKNYGGESFVQGTENQLLGTITIDTDPDEGYDGANSDTKASAVIGNKNVIQHGLKHSLVVGSQNTVNSGCQQIITIGQKNKIGKSCNWTNTFGDSNEVKSYSIDSTVFGYQNKVYGGANSNNPTQYVYMFGRNNDNRGPDSTANSNVFLIGEYLNATRDQQVVVGCCNTGDSTETNAFFVVGTGDLGEPNTPKTTFMVKDGETDFKGIIKIGNTSLSEAQLQSLLALI